MTGMFVLIFASVLMARVLADPRTRDSSAGARLGKVSGWSMSGKNGPTKLRISQRCGLHLIHPPPLLLKEYHPSPSHYLV
jgi:hypothetical protein